MSKPDAVLVLAGNQQEGRYWLQQQREQPGPPRRHMVISCEERLGLEGLHLDSCWTVLCAPGAWRGRFYGHHLLCLIYMALQEDDPCSIEFLGEGPGITEARLALLGRRFDTERQDRVRAECALVEQARVADAVTVDLLRTRRQLEAATKAAVRARRVRARRSPRRRRAAGPWRVRRLTNA